MANRDVVVVAASAGGIEALREVLAGLPPDFPAALLIVLHMPATGGQALPKILGRVCALPTSSAVDAEPLVPGRVYVCVGDHHLLVADGHVHVRRGARENGHRPAADPLFRSAARYYGRRVIGVILSGTLSDGTAGLLAVSRRGGVSVVQEPSDALYDGMPLSALEYVRVDHVVTAAEIGPLLVELVAEGLTGDEREPTGTMIEEVTQMETVEGVGEQHRHPGRPSPWPCPDCNGVLWAIEDEDQLRFRCRVGHAWWPDNLLAKQGEAVETALWMALRSLEDRAALSEQMAARAARSGRHISAARFAGDLEGLHASIATLRSMLHVEAAGTAQREVELE